MKEEPTLGKYYLYASYRYRCVEDKDGNGCEICDLNKKKMKIKDAQGLTICDVVRCGEKNRLDGKNVYFVRKKHVYYKRRKQSVAELEQHNK
jgi:hypothetical protein